MATQTLPERRSVSATIPSAVDVRLLGVRKTYGDVVAVDRVDLEVEAGEFFTLLGPSGSGKTTTLRLIAGFERPDEGRVELSGVDVTSRAPYERHTTSTFPRFRSGWLNPASCSSRKPRASMPMRSAGGSTAMRSEIAVAPTISCISRQPR